MESQLKQRLVGAAVLVALAVIFLPMLVKGPAPDSGVSDVPLKVPDAPEGDYQTRDLPLVVPDQAPDGGAVGMPQAQPADGRLPTVDTAAAAEAAARDGDAAPPEPMLPPTAAGGDYAVHFGAYASSVDADTVVARLRDARLPAFREAAAVDGKSAWRVRIGPYATEADAELARVEAVRVGRRSGARVVALDAAEPAGASVAQPIAAADKPVAAQPLPAPSATPAPAPAKPDAKPSATPRAAEPPPAVAQAPAASPAPEAAATGVGFAVQIGAFGNAAQASAKRDQLRAAGFGAFTETVQTDKGRLTRVLAGPVVSRAEADRLKAQVKARLGIDGLVRSHP